MKTKSSVFNLIEITLAIVVAGIGVAATSISLNLFLTMNDEMRSMCYE